MCCPAFPFRRGDPPRRGQRREDRAGRPLAPHLLRRRRDRQRACGVARARHAALPGGVLPQAARRRHHGQRHAGRRPGAGGARWPPPRRWGWPPCSASCSPRSGAPLAEHGLAISAGVTLYVAASNLVPEFQAKRGWAMPAAVLRWRGGVFVTRLMLGGCGERRTVSWARRVPVPVPGTLPLRHGTSSSRPRASRGADAAPHPRGVRGPAAAPGAGQGARRRDPPRRRGQLHLLGPAGPRQDHARAADRPKHTEREFVEFSAVTEGVPRVREIIKEAEDRRRLGRGHGALLRRDPPLQPGPAGRLPAPRRAGHRSR